MQHTSLKNRPRKRDPIGRSFAVPCGMTFRSDPLVRLVIGCGIEVHRVLGPGLLEPAYRPCLAWELKEKGIAFRTEVSVPVRYKGAVIDCAYRIDFLVEDRLVLELKSVERIIPVHVAQVATYLRLLNTRQGLIMNFNVPRLKDGIKSVLARDAVVDESPRSLVTHEDLKP